ncbi:MAG: hypothetical protein HQK83_12735 [Fibrobacteria bacterium]|nr:hypothetical protein [Fibrobacteria bacterium]
MKATILFILPFFFILFTGCGEKELKSLWTDGAITVDGDIDDWITGTIYLKKLNAAFAVKNDSANLYLYLITRDRELKRRILNMGFTLWFGEENSKEKKSGLRFPGRFQGKVSLKDMKNGPQDEEEMIAALEDINTRLDVVQTEDEKTKRIPLSRFGSSDIQAKLGYSKSNLICEIRMPFKSGDGKKALIEIVPGKTCMIGFVTNPIDKRLRNQQMNSAGRSGGGGRRGMGFDGDGIGGGGKMGGRSGKHGGNTISKEKSFWAKVLLAETEN